MSIACSVPLTTTGWPVFVEFAPLSTGPLEGRDRETVPRSDEEQRKCARSESGGWVVPDSDRRQTGLASLAQLSLPFGRSGAGRYASERAHLSLKVGNPISLLRRFGRGHAEVGAYEPVEVTSMGSSVAPGLDFELALRDTVALIPAGVQLPR